MNITNAEACEKAATLYRHAAIIDHNGSLSYREQPMHVAHAGQKVAAPTLVSWSAFLRSSELGLKLALHTKAKA